MTPLSASRPRPMPNRARPSAWVSAASARARRRARRAQGRPRRPATRRHAQPRRQRRSPGVSPVSTAASTHRIASPSPPPSSIRVHSAAPSSPSSAKPSVRASGGRARRGGARSRPTWCTNGELRWVGSASWNAAAATVPVRGHLPTREQDGCPGSPSVCDGRAGQPSQSRPNPSRTHPPLTFGGAAAYARSGRSG